MSAFERKCNGLGFLSASGTTSEHRSKAFEGGGGAKFTALGCKQRRTAADTGP